MDSNTKKGDLFEEYVESLYQSLGYSTERNIEVNGRQIDIIANKIIKGFGKIVLLIECKYLTKGSVSNQVIYNFDSFLISASSTYKFHKGVIVTNSSFSRQSKSHKSNLIELSVEEGLVYHAEDYVYSSARDYSAAPSVLRRCLRRPKLCSIGDKLCSAEATRKRCLWRPMGGKGILEGLIVVK